MQQSTNRLAPFVLGECAQEGARCKDRPTWVQRGKSHGGGMYHDHEMHDSNTHKGLFKAKQIGLP